MLLLDGVAGCCGWRKPASESEGLQRVFSVSIVPESPSFRVTVTNEGRVTVLALQGKVENYAAFELGIVLDSAIDRRPESVILDLSGLEFIGASGMVAISNAERRLAGLGAQLTVRSPSVLVNRVLAIMEATEESRVERASPGHARLGPEDPRPLSTTVSRFAPSVASTDLRQVTALPTDPDVVDGALRLVVELAKTCVKSADGVSVSLRRNGVLSTVAASDHTIMAMDADQYATGEGPCVDASLKGHWFHAESLDTERRWPSFTPRARGLGIRAILSSPLKAFEQPVGALNIYSRTAESFEIQDQEAAAVFAQKASVILSDARVGVSETQMALRYKEALLSRHTIALATGVIMEREGVDEDDAFTALLRLSLYQGE
jgi:anti-anti-sigma factor